jgi:hypothetical protein
VKIDRAGVTFRFEGSHRLLFVGHRFSYRDHRAGVTYDYEITERGAPDPSRQWINVSGLQDATIVGVVVISRDELRLAFDSGVELSVFDHPEWQSWWFSPRDFAGVDASRFPTDLQLCDMTPEERRARVG